MQEGPSIKPLIAPGNSPVIRESLATVGRAETPASKAFTEAAAKQKPLLGTVTDTLGRGAQTMDRDLEPKYRKLQGLQTAIDNASNDDSRAKLQREYDALRGEYDQRQALAESVAVAASTDLQTPTIEGTNTRILALRVYSEHLTDRLGTLDPKLAKDKPVIEALRAEQEAIKRMMERMDGLLAANRDAGLRMAKLTHRWVRDRCISHGPTLVTAEMMAATSKEARQQLLDKLQAERDAIYAGEKPKDEAAKTGTDTEVKADEATEPARAPISPDLARKVGNAAGLNRAQRKAVSEAQMTDDERAKLEEALGKKGDKKKALLAILGGIAGLAGIAVLTARSGGGRS